jgi:hypothetical protein
MASSLAMLQRLPADARCAKQFAGVGTLATITALRAPLSPA